MASIIPHFFHVAQNNIEIIRDLKRQFSNDQELGRELRKFLDSVKSNPPSPYTIQLDEPFDKTILVMKDAMKAVAKDVRLPKIVRDGRVKPRKK